MPIPTAPAQRSHRLLRDIVFDRLSDAIVAGELAPGEELRDESLQAWLGTSRTPLREAINRLAHAGLVEVLPQRATRVTEIDPVFLVQNLQVVGPLYAAVAAEVTPLLTPADLTELKRLRKQVAASPTLDGLLEFFLVLSTRYGNRLMLKTHAAFEPHARRLLKSWSDDFDRSAILPLLDPLLSALQAGQAETARVATATFFEFVTGRILGVDQTRKGL
jgi:DNA-binding GntR family transcriptional regulator